MMMAFGVIDIDSDDVQQVSQQSVPIIVVVIRLQNIHGIWFLVKNRNMP